MIELDKDTYGPDNHLAEWHRSSSGQNDLDGFTVSHLLSCGWFGRMTMLPHTCTVEPLNICPLIRACPLLAGITTIGKFMIGHCTSIINRCPVYQAYLDLNSAS